MPVSGNAPPSERPRWTPEGLQTLALRLTHEAAEAPLGRIPEAVRALLRSLGTQVGVDRIAVFVLTRDRRRLQTLTAWQDAIATEPPVVELRAATSVFVQRVIRGEIVRLERVEDELAGFSASDGEALRKLRLKSSLGLPLRVGGGTVGACTLGSVQRPIAWPTRFIQDMTCVADVLALTVHRLRSHQQREQERLEHDRVQHVAGIGHWRHNPALQATVGSPELYRMLQLDTRRELTPALMVECVVPPDADRFRAHVLGLMLGEEVPPLEVRVRRGDGEIRWFRCWGRASDLHQGVPQLVDGIMHDVTEHKRAEHALEVAHARLVQAQEDERARLGRELHDELGQRIAALDLRLASMSNDVREKAPSVTAGLNEAIEQVQELGFIARSVSHALYPVELERLGLARSLQSLCQRSAAHDTIDVDLEAGDVPDELPDATELALYRVTQESLGNALRHSNAGHISVFLGVQGDRLRLTISDDGVGFSRDAPAAAEGLGLSSMEERMRLVHGTFTIHSSPGAGTQVCAEVPLNPVSDPT